MKYPIWHPFSQMQNLKPEKVIAAKGAWLELENGNKVLDMISSWWVNIHGHANEQIAKALYEQALNLEHVIFADFNHHPALELVNRLKKYLPINLAHFFFSDNGSTAIEVALKITKQYWYNQGEFHKNRFIAFSGAYHGDTLGAMSISSPSIFNKPFADLLFNASHISYPALDENQDIEALEKKSLEELQSALIKNKNEYAAIIIEPLVQGASGMRMCRKEFLQKLKVIAKSENILLIFDEVMTGFGRTGDWFACKKSQTDPDIICLSKGLTGGALPMSLTICIEKIYDAFVGSEEKTFFHGHSYTGNPLGCIAAITSFDLLEKNETFPKLEAWHQENITILKKNPLVKNPRICGTIAAIDLKTEGSSFFQNKTQKIKELCLQQGVYIRPLSNVLYFLPPYCITFQELQHAYSVLDSCLKAVQ